MDPRERADAALARARARGAFVVTPDDAISPMDATSTQQIPRSVVAAADNADNTMVIARSQINQAYQQTQAYQQSPAYQQSQPYQQGQPQQQYPVEQPYPEPEEPPAPRPVDGLVPTVQQPSPQRSLLSRRLDGN
jgi:nicotinamidase-related amidase